MDFFTGQIKARRRTGLLVFVFAAAVLLIALAIYFIVAFAFWMNLDPEGRLDFLSWALQQYGLMASCAAGTILVVGLGTGAKVMMLRAGGEAIALSLGGRQIPPNSRERRERRLLNIVEEMAIASGTPVPRVFVMDNELGINAFAAGLSTNDAVIAVTRGTLEILNREELQGVIGHEFSHILNGDMRLNLRLVGVVHGILLIGILGYLVFRVALHSMHGVGRGSGDSKGKGGAMAAMLAIMAIGGALIVIGYLGTFCGRIIKAAVSRQREFLADGASVQFTRNPGGIAGALKKIGGFSQGSRIRNPRGEEASHMFFSMGFTSFFGSLLATHPPLDQRIRRIQPDFDGVFPQVKSPKGREGRAGVAGFAGAAAEAPASAKPRKPGKQKVRVKALASRPGPEQLTFAAEVAASIPTPLREATREPFGARAVVYALLLDRRDEVRLAQLTRLAEKADRQVYAETRKLVPFVGRIKATARLPILELSVAGLRELSRKQYEAFRENVDFLIQADQEVEFFEWTLTRVLEHHLRPAFPGKKGRTPKVHGRRVIADAAGVLLGALARVGAETERDAAHAFSRGAQAMPRTALNLPSLKECDLPALDKAMKILEGAPPSFREAILEACTLVISADRKLTVEEAELFRVTAAVLGASVPLPLLEVEAEA